MTSNNKQEVTHSEDSVALVVKADLVDLEASMMHSDKVVAKVDNLLEIFLTNSKSSLGKVSKAVVGRGVAARLKLEREET